MSTQKTDVELLNKKQAAEYLGVRPKTLRKTYKKCADFRALFKPLGSFYFTTAEKLDDYYRN